LSSTNDTTSFDTMFGRMAVDQRLCTEDELQRCQEEAKQRQASEPVSIEYLLIEHQFITKNQAHRLRSSIRDSKDTASQIPGYKVISKLGSGAMAVVYKAKQISLDRVVAVKVLPKRFSEKPDYIRRFFQEGKIAAKLNHNNIVQAIDVGEAGGVYYFVMEYVEGKTLYDDLSKGKIFVESEALDVTIQLAHALQHAHSQGLIHRDVKPKNVMINTEGVVKLADMGLARETADIKAARNEQGKAFGTPYYIAPEQIRGELDIDGRADMYSLGATLYHMVTGRVPFDATTPSEVMRKHLKEPLIPPDHLNTLLSAGISEVIEVMMAKNRQDRYANVDELLLDLEAIRKGQSPLRARQKFNLQALEQLEQGETVNIETKDTSVVPAETVTRYRVTLVILVATVAILFLVILILTLK
jgi:eukaryotic-like serine/threonine-protein kinase